MTLEETEARNFAEKWGITDKYIIDDLAFFARAAHAAGEAVGREKAFREVGVWPDTTPH